MKLTLAMALVLGLGSTAFADDTCFEVSTDARTWSKTPELFCVSNVKDADYTLTLRTGMPGAQQDVMTLRLNLLTRARCIDCNKDVFGIANPSNSVGNAFQVKFNGTRDTKTFAEQGVLQIGPRRLYYRGKAGASPIPTPPIVKSPPPVTPPPVVKSPPPTTTPPPVTNPVDKKNPHQSPPTHQPAPSQ